MPDRVAVVAAIRQNDQATDLAQHLRGAPHVRFVAGDQLEIDQLAPAVSHRVELVIAAPFGFSKFLLFRGLGEVAGVLVDFDVGGVDDLELVRIRREHGRFDHQLEDSALGPAVVEAVDAVPLTVAFGKLVPLAAGDKNPPDAAQRFEKISRRTALFINVRLAFARVKLIFYVLKQHSEKRLQVHIERLNCTCRRLICAPFYGIRQICITA